MAQYLLAAGADRIQDLLFRSSQLREVVGGSQLLTRFCEHEDNKDMLYLLSDRLGITPDVITSGGGSFRLRFETEENARRFGAALAEAYYRATGGTLSVAEPVSMTDGYGLTSEKVGENLSRAKHGGPSIVTPQIPYIAFCESCGVGLAEAHEARFDEEEGHYLCPSCRAKSAEWEEHSRGNFLKRFYEKVKSSADWPPTPEDVAQYDPRDYVAYIVADGDSMGRVFGGCDKDQAQALSKKMGDALREALAEPTRQFMKNDVAKQASCIPVLPLILGGDDLFALVPARWGLDIARRLCRTFQSEMTKWARDHNIPHEITMSAAVVICKANYPYYLAHQIGEERLNATKRAVKALGDQGPRLSAVDFEVVLGSQVTPHEQTGKQRPTLRPYWVTDGKVPSGWGLSVNNLLDWRYQLVNNAPSRRLSQLREHFDRMSEMRGDHWDEGLQRILKRIERDWTRKGKHPVRKALDDLGGINLGDWYELDRKNDKDFRRGHGMPDLLQAWDWTLNLDHPPIAYEGGER